MNFVGPSVAVLLFLTGCGPDPAQPQPVTVVSADAGSADVRFEGDVVPVLVQHCSRCHDTWNIGGRFDFGDAFAGPAEFEFPAVALFVAKGNRALFREFLRAYGAQLDPTDTLGPFHERMLAYTLIHKYSNLAWYLKEIPVEVEEVRLELLAAAWFDVS